MYSPVDYYALGAVYPRDALRQPYPRRARRSTVALLEPPVVPPVVLGPLTIAALGSHLPGAIASQEGRLAGVVAAAFLPGEIAAGGVKPGAAAAQGRVVGS